ncbi:MAG TPA: PKD domain-containing protein [Actinomycetota bacterium]
MQGRARREAGFPGERFVFDATPDPGSTDQVHWSGGGDPSTGTGKRFTTTFGQGGTYQVTATSGSETRSFEVQVAPLEQWLADAAGFYGPSVDLSKVTVKATWAVFGPSGTGWTCNTVVRFKRAKRMEDLPVEPTLMHELGHVWEHQSGQLQLLKGIVEQLGRMFGRDPYDYGGPDGVRKASKLTRFKKEGQAQIIMEHWKAVNGYDSDSKGVSLFTPGYADDLRRLVEGAGIGRTAADRRTVARAIDSGFARTLNSLLGVME